MFKMPNEWGQANQAGNGDPQRRLDAEVLKFGRTIPLLEVGDVHLTKIGRSTRRLSKANRYPNSG